MHTRKSHAHKPSKLTSYWSFTKVPVAVLKTIKNPNLTKQIVWLKCAAHNLASLWWAFLFSFSLAVEKRDFTIIPHVIDRDWSRHPASSSCLNLHTYRDTHLCYSSEAFALKKARFVDTGVNPGKMVLKLEQVGLYPIISVQMELLCQ